MHEVLIKVDGKQDVKIFGKLLGEVDVGASAISAIDVWHKLQIFELSNGDWLAVRFRDQTSLLAPSEVGEIERIYKPEAESAPYASPDDPSPLASMVAQTMKFFGWSWLAKKLAEKMEWPTLREIR